jgi:hypothetical protein
METAMAEFAAALAIGRLDADVAEQVRGYLRRYLDRMRTLMPSMWGA